MFYLLACFIGAIIATTELLYRFQASPLQAIINRWGSIYLVINAGLSAVAFLAIELSGIIDESATTIDYLQYSLMAGFGAMVVLRAKLFNFYNKQGEIEGFGPDFVITRIYNFLVNEIDQKLALKRLNIIKKIMVNIDYKKTKEPLIQMMTQSMQNISKEKLAKLARKIAELEKSKLSNQEKSDGLGFQVLDIAGEKLLEKFFKDSREDYEITLNPIQN